MKIAAFSDTHFPHSLQDPRYPDYKRTLGRMVDAMLERKVDLVLFGGDAGRTHKIPAAVLYDIGECLKRLKGASPWIQVIGVVGNHDLDKSAGGVHALACTDWMGIKMHSKPALIKVLTGWSDPPMDDGRKVQLILLPYPNKALLLSKEEYHDLPPDEVNAKMHDLLVTILHDLAGKLDPNLPSILLAHLALDTAKVGSEQGMMFGRDVCLSVTDIPDNIDYCFFGHVHKPQEMHITTLASGKSLAHTEGPDGLPRKLCQLVQPDFGDPATIAQLTPAGVFNAQIRHWIWIIGSMETVNHGEEGEEKRWLLLDTEAGTVESIPTGARPYKTFHLNLIEGQEGDDMDDPSIVGAVTRVKARMHRGQTYDFGKLRRGLLAQGAFSVRIEPEYEDAPRDVTEAVESPEQETYEGIVRSTILAMPDMADRVDELTKACMKELEGVAG